MTIGANDILNTNTEITQDKSAKKTDYTSGDFSTISNQFANIFSNQFANHFQNQFSYSQNQVKHDFMANTATSMTENKYYAPSNKISQQSTSSQNTAQKETPKEAPKQEVAQQQNTNSSVENNNAATQQQTETSAEATQNQAEAVAQTVVVEAKPEVKTEAKTEEKSEKKGEAKPQIKTEVKPEDVAAQTIVIQQNIASEAVVSDKKTEKQEKDAKTLTGSVSTEQKVSTEKTTSIKVAVKEDQLKEVNELAQKTLETMPEVSEVKDAKIEKLDVKTSKKEHHEAKKEIKAEVKEEKEEAKTTVKAEHAAIKEEVKNKESLERLTANVIEKTPEETTVLDKLLNKTAKKASAQTKESQDTKSAIEFKNPTAFTNQNSEQNFGQNQNNQNPLKDGMFKGLLNIDASLLKNNISGNMQFNNIVQNSQPKTIMERNITEQVLNQIKGEISTDKSQVSMVLNPEKLGKVTLNIMNEKGVMTAEIKTETKEAAEALNKSVNELRETLKQQGVICANLVVKVEEPAKSENQMNFANQNQEHTPQNFEQGGNAQNSNKDTFQNSSNNKETAKAEYQNNIQEEQGQASQTTKAEDNGLVDYRV